MTGVAGAFAGVDNPADAWLRPAGGGATAAVVGAANGVVECGLPAGCRPVEDDCEGERVGGSRAAATLVDVVPTRAVAAEEAGGTQVALSVGGGQALTAGDGRFPSSNAVRPARVAAPVAAREAPCTGLARALESASEAREDTDASARRNGDKGAACGAAGAPAASATGTEAEGARLRAQLWLATTGGPAPWLACKDRYHASKSRCRRSLFCAATFLYVSMSALTCFKRSVA